MNTSNFWLDIEKPVINRKGMKRKVINNIDRKVE
jgi:hypothetical protein